MRIYLLSRILCLFLAAISLSPPVANAVEVYPSREKLLTVVFDDHLESAAEQISAIYPRIAAELESFLTWRIDFRPTIYLTQKAESFQRLAGSDLFTAVAIPRKDLIVIDYPKMHATPFLLTATLKHELCHLLLHRHIARDNLPRWLDEGIAQWVSDGVSEMVSGGDRITLRNAILRRNHIPLWKLTSNFPQDRRSLMLAYEESKSVVSYVNATYGKKAIINLLRQMKNGSTIEAAVEKSLDTTLEKLERDWLANIKRSTSWYTYLAVHLYELLFFFGAVLTIWAFVKLVILRKRYEQEPEDELDI
ncbi:MAG: hypothetical protein JRJ12_11290 [Deltaproteobacteria bacterium]|nr:hypothetical protein [Deltaproteobacteria bacterium]MBW2071855.1 hypothetical protein [Deltaproteobacteria bacterium]